MVNTIQLGEQQRTVLFGNLAFKWLKEEAGLTITGIGNALNDTDLTFIPTVLYYGLRAGERYDKKEAGVYDADDVALWLDMEPGSTMKALPWILDAIKDMTGNEQTDETDDPAKKKTPKRKI